MIENELTTKLIKKMTSKITDTIGSTLLVSDSKTEGFRYTPVDVAMSYNFIQVGSNRFSGCVSVDIDDTTDITEVGRRLLKENVPEPTMVVRTNRGFHLHWVLNNPVQIKNKKALFLRNLTERALVNKLGGDIRAVGAKRIFRNPTQHNTIVADIMYDLDDFKLIRDNIIYTSTKGVKPFSTGTKGGRVRGTNIDLTKITKGGRHQALFKVVSNFAYSVSDLSNTELNRQVLSYATKCNNMLQEPQSRGEIDTLVQSITEWVITKYTGVSDNKKEFNQNLAKASKLRTIHKILKVLLDCSINLLTLRDIRELSARKGGKLCDVTKDTFLKHKLEVIFILTTTLNTALENEHFLSLLELFELDLDVINLNNNIVDAIAEQSRAINSG